MDPAFLFRVAVILLICLAAAPAARASTALVHESTDAGLARALAARLRKSGFDVRTAGNDSLREDIAARPDLLVLANARRFPAEALPALETYLTGAGHLLAIGGPMFEEMLVKADGRWITRAAAEQDFAKNPPEHMLFQFKPGDEKRWRHSTNHPEFDERLSVRDGALASFVSGGGGWNIYLSERLDKPFSAGDTVTVFEARGDRNTPKLTVEWREADGSRWITSVKLSEKWTRFALGASDFRYWPDNDSKGRGGAGDQFNPASAVQLSFGLTEDGGVNPKGPHIFWVRDVGTSSDRLRELRKPVAKLETLSPSYKVYPMRGVRRLSARSDQAIVDRNLSLMGRFDGVMPVWRPRGLGYSRDYLPGTRFVPCVDAFDRGSEWRGTAAWMLLHFEGPFAGGIWAAIGVRPDHLSEGQRDSIAGVAEAMASRMFSSPFIRAAGAEPFALKAGVASAFAAGCAVAGRQSSTAAVSPELVLVQEGKETELYDGEERTVAPGAAERWERDGISCAAQPGPARVITRLTQDGRVVDIVSQPVSILPASPGGECVSVASGQFVLAGKPLYANGVNYWPRSRAGLEQDELSRGWLHHGRYDPEVVERDLQILEGLDVNLVSIMYTDPASAPQLVDFLERCRHHRILVNIYIDGGHPLRPNLPKVRELIEAPGLPGNSQVFAYDLAWEPTLGRQDRRAAFDGEWRDWIIEQYGSMERAEKDWGVAVPHGEGGVPSSPADAELTGDGPGRVMVAAYRRFADDLVSRGYGRVARFVRSVDPNHLVGARTGWGGTGQPWPVPAMPFDLASGAAHLDFTSPEGYGLEGSLDDYLAAGFTTEYGRFVSGGKPVFWAEYGLSIWPDVFSTEALRRQADHYRKSYEMFTRSSANGSAAWWWPGGFRVEEVSDYGLVCQDCEPRPAARVIDEMAPRAQAALELPEAAGEIVIDRDRHVDGYAGVWASAKQGYLANLKSGRRMAIRTEGTGSTSADCPAVAVGGVPWTGDNPARYLNAEICCVEIGDEDGKWKPVDGDGPVTAPRGRPLRVRAVLTNTGEAKWLRKAEGPGAVTLRLKMGETAVEAALLSDVPSLQAISGVTAELPAVSEASTVELRLNCSGRGLFGQRLNVSVVPGD